MSLFKPATRERAHLKVALTGPSGSGKTYSAILMAMGLAGPKGRIAVIDTENESASLYAHLGKYDTLCIAPPFTVPKYRDAILAAVAEGYDVVIIDSLSHVWASEGGLLSTKESLDARGGNSYTNWASITKMHDILIGIILQSPVDVIATMRSKQAHVLQENEKGKLQPVKMGMAPVQRDGMEYEFMVVLDIAMNHEATSSKDRTGLFVDQTVKIDKKSGQLLKKWRDSGAAPEPTPPPAPATEPKPPASPETKPPAEKSVAKPKTSPKQDPAPPAKPEDTGPINGPALDPEGLQPPLPGASTARDVFPLDKPIMVALTNGAFHQGPPQYYAWDMEAGGRKSRLFCWHLNMPKVATKLDKPEEFVGPMIVVLEQAEVANRRTGTSKTVYRVKDFPDAK